MSKTDFAPEATPAFPNADLGRRGVGPLIDEESIERYHRDGIAKIRVPPEIRSLQSDFLEECRIWLRHYGPAGADFADVPFALAELAKQDRLTVGRLYKIARRFVSAKRLAIDPWFVGVAGSLMRTSLVSCCHFVNVRIDLPGEDDFLLPVHQDFPYIQGSYNAITIWLPFHDTPLKSGPPAWILGSHRDGVHDVSEKRYGTGAIPSGGRSFEIANTESFGDRIFQSADVPYGAALVFSTLLIHQSQQNRSAKARINIQLRFDDALAPESFERNYPDGLYLSNPFATSYPEHVLTDEHF